MNTIIFDLDGTIIDSFEGIYSCYKRSLKDIDIKPVEISEFKPKIGASFDKMLGEIHPEINDNELISYIIKVFRSHYDKHGYKQYVVYEKIHSILQLIDNHSWKAAILSNKKDLQVKEIISKEFSGFQIGSYGKIGADWSKVQKVKELKAKFTIRAFVGDTQEDYLCAKTIAQRFIHANYGYGKIKDCINYRVCETTGEVYEEIEGIILSNKW